MDNVISGQSSNDNIIYTMQNWNEMVKQLKWWNKIQNQALQITITMRKSNISNINLTCIIPCKSLLQMIRLNKIDDDSDIYSYSCDSISF